MAEPVVRTEGLTKSYGPTLGLDHLDLEVPAGAVFGYLGPNGAGKTTTIRLLMGLLRPTHGRAEVAGYDAWSQRTAAHRRTGYLPGDFSAYGDLTGEEFLSYLGNLRQGFDRSFVDLLAKRFDLDLTRRIGTLSSGNRQKVGLVQAFMHRPELLILDEPSAGLDPLMQREFLELVREARSAGQTVFLSSHVLTEVEQVADSVAIIRQGHLVVVERVAALKARAVRRLDLTFVDDPPPVEVIKAIPNVREARISGRTMHVAVEGSLAALLRTAADGGLDNVVTHEADLEEIFLSYYAEGS